jgi:quercetin dioxygenase-like cupin family protein
MPIHRFKAGFDWEDVPVHPYKEEGTHFRSITRRTLFHGTGQLPCEVRYFEIAAGGHSTLERHEHEHLVIIQRGSGSVLIGNEVGDFSPFDVIEIPPRTWHQFRAAKGEAFGFLCIVNTRRDRPRRPSAEELEQLKATPGSSNFIRT